jgi:hypothetical protein
VKRLIKRALRPFWRMTGPIRRPLSLRLNQKLHAMVAQAVRQEVLPPIQASLEASAHAMARLEASIGVANHAAQTLATDIDLMLGSLIREIARLQMQMDGLADSVDGLALPTRSSLSLVERDEDSEPIERAMVG